MNRLTKMQYYFYGIGVSYFMLDQVYNQWLNYFYIPPADSTMKPILSANLIFIGFMIIRLIDALSDIVIGHMSDNSNSKLGKRSYFMFLGGLPLGLSMILFFYPPHITNQLLVLIYFIIIGSVYFVSYTLVGGPYNSMIADFSSTKEERLNLSTVQSVFRLIFTALPLIFSGYLIKILGNGNITKGIRHTVILFSVIGVLGVYLCIFLLKEKNLKVHNKEIKEKLKFKEVVKYLRRKEIYLYFIGFFLFFSGFNVIRNVLTYYVTLIMKQGPGTVTKISAVMFGVSAIFFPITNILAKKYGNRKIMVTNLITIILPALYLVVARPNNNLIVYILFAIIGAGFSGSAFIFPPAMLSEICYEIKKESNVNIDGLMFGIQGFFLKLAFLAQSFVTTILIVSGSTKLAEGQQYATVKGVYLSITVAIGLLFLSTIFYYINKKK